MLGQKSCDFLFLLFVVTGQALDKEVLMLSHEESNLGPLHPDVLQLSQRDSTVR